MNRRGFLGLLSKIVTIGTVIGVPSSILEPVQKQLTNWLVVDAAGNGDFTTIQAALDALPKTGGTIFVREGDYFL